MERSQEKKAKRKIQKVAGAIIVLAILSYGCVRKVYLPEDAAYYMDLYRECKMKEKTLDEIFFSCEEELNRCEELSEDLMVVP